MHEEGRADEAAAVHALGRHAGPEVGESQHGMGGLQDGLRTLVQGLAPLGLRLCDLLAHVARAAVGVAHLEPATLLAQVLEPVPGHDVGNRGALAGGFLIHDAREGGDNHLRGGVPGMVLLEAHARDAGVMDPARVLVRCLHLGPGIAARAHLQHVHRRSQQGLGHHFRVEVGGSAKVANGDVDDAVFLRESSDAEEQAG